MLDVRPERVQVPEVVYVVYTPLCDSWQTLDSSTVVKCDLTINHKVDAVESKPWFLKMRGKLVIRNSSQMETKKMSGTVLCKARISPPSTDLTEDKKRKKKWLIE